MLPSSRRIVGLNVYTATFCKLPFVVNHAYIVINHAYNYIKNNNLRFNGWEKVYGYIEELPTVDKVKGMLIKMGCPVRFSEIGVRKETFNEMIEKAYTVRDRYTVLTLSHELGITEKLKPILADKYF